MTVLSAFLSFEKKTFNEYSAFLNIVNQHALCVSAFSALVEDFLSELFYYAITQSKALSSMLEMLFYLKCNKV